MVLLQSDQFLEQLAKLFQESRTSGCVRLTLKQYDGRTKPKPRNADESVATATANICLMRASSNKRKISTLIHQKDVERFQSAYRALVRSQMDGLKKIKQAKKTGGTTPRGKRIKDE